MFNHFEEVPMQASKHLIAAALAIVLAAGSPAQAQSEASALSAVSALPFASVIAGTGAAAAGSLAGTVLLSSAGAAFVVKAVEATASSTVYVLERLSDGARVSVEVTGRIASSASVAAGSMMVVSVISAGVILSSAGEAIAFIPNALGRALLYNERLTY
jgi:hypothetical protein